MDLSIDAAWLEATALAGVRITVFLFLAPPFSYGAMPARVRAILAVGLSLAVGGSVADGYEPLATGAFLGALSVQLLTGALLGLMVQAVFSAVQGAGHLIDVFGGFQLAQAYDPLGAVNGAQFTRLFQLAAVVLLFASDGYQLIIAGLVRSFEAVPLTGVFSVPTPSHLLTDVLGQAMLASVQIAGPLLLVLFLADAGLGLLTRVAPQLNAFALGFPLKIMLTLALAGVVIVALPSLVASLTGDALSHMQGVSVQP